MEVRRVTTAVKFKTTDETPRQKTIEARVEAPTDEQLVAFARAYARLWDGTGVLAAADKIVTTPLALS